MQTKTHRKTRLGADEYLQPDELVDFVRFMRRRARSLKSPSSRLNAAMAETLALSGLRASELCALTVGELGSDGTLFVASGKGNKERIVDIPGDLVETLTKWLQDYRQGAEKADRVFVSRTGAPFSYRRIWERAGVWSRQWGVKDFTPHGLRHSYAIRFLHLNGTDDRVLVHLMTQLGHSDLKTTMIYAQTAMVDRRRYADGLTVGEFG